MLRFLRGGEPSAQCMTNNIYEFGFPSAEPFQFVIRGPGPYGNLVTRQSIIRYGLYKCRLRLPLSNFVAMKLRRRSKTPPVIVRYKLSRIRKNEARAFFIRYI